MAESRAERKERTRRAILDATLALCDDRPLAALSLRQVAKEVGIVPTAFYRHFASIEDLGLALVAESFDALRTLLADARTPDGPVESDRDDLLTLVDTSVGALASHVPEHDRHFRFIARERLAGPQAVREAMRQQIDLVGRELATDIAQLPAAHRWSGEDLLALADLLVNALLAHAEELALAGDRPAVLEGASRAARRQLRMVVIGALRWDSET